MSQELTPISNSTTLPFTQLHSPISTPYSDQRIDDTYNNNNLLNNNNTNTIFSTPPQSPPSSTNRVSIVSNKPVNTIHDFTITQKCEKDQQKRTALGGYGDIQHGENYINPITNQPFDNQLTIHFHNLTSTLTVKESDYRIQKLYSPVTNILRNISSCGRNKVKFMRIQRASGIIYPGTMTLVISGPGGGKSSYLRLLANRIRPDNEESILYNGLTPSQAAKTKDIDIRKMIRYMDQVDQHLPLLTVRETLLFAAKTNSTTFSHEKVDQIITLLGLDECKNNYGLNISGGQKKRLSVGELLCTDATTLCLDQYSDGLDSATALDITIALKQWCKNTNGSIICTLQQPGPEITELFDRIVVVQESNIIYDGPRVDVVPYFRGMGFIQPPDVDMIDFIINTLVASELVYQQSILERQRENGFVINDSLELALGSKAQQRQRQTLSLRSGSHHLLALGNNNSMSKPDTSNNSNNNTNNNSNTNNTTTNNNNTLPLQYPYASPPQFNTNTIPSTVVEDDNSRDSTDDIHNAMDMNGNLPNHNSHSSRKKATTQSSIQPTPIINTNQRTQEEKEDYTKLPSESISTSIGFLDSAKEPCLTTQQMVSYYHTSPFYINLMQELRIVFPKGQFTSTLPPQTSAQVTMEYKHLTLTPTNDAKIKFSTKVTTQSKIAPVFVRELRILSRLRMLFIPRFMQGLVMALLYGGLYFNVQESDFYLRISSLLIGLTQVALSNRVEVPVFFEHSQVANKQVSHGYYPSWVFILASLARSFPMCLVETIVFTFILYFMCNHALYTKTFLLYFAMLLTQSINLSVIFKFLTSLAPTIESAQSIAQTVLNFFMVFGGFFIGRSSILEPMLPLYWISSFSWSNRALVIGEFSSPRYDQLVPFVDPNTGRVDSLRLGEIYLRESDMFISQWWILWGFLYLIGITIGFIILHSFTLSLSYWREETRGTRRANDDIIQWSDMKVMGTEEEDSDNEENDRNDIECNDNNDDVQPSNSTLHVSQYNTNNADNNTNDNAIVIAGHVHHQRNYSSDSNSSSNTTFLTNITENDPTATSNMSTTTPMGLPLYGIQPEQQQSQQQGQSSSQRKHSLLSHQGHQQRTNQLTLSTAHSTHSAYNNYNESGQPPSPRTIRMRNHNDKFEAAILHDTQLAAVTNLQRQGQLSAQQSIELQRQVSINVGPSNVPRLPPPLPAPNMVTAINNNNNNINHTIHPNLNTNQYNTVPNVSPNNIQLDQQNNHNVQANTNAVASLPTLNKYLPFAPTWLSFENLIYSVQVKNDKGKKVSKKLLNSVSGLAAPGKITGLLGVSGAGKSTLLDVLSFRKTAGELTGKILLNGQPATKSMISSITGYVEQFDSLFAYSTVRETLEFVAKLKLPRNLTNEIRNDIIDEVLDILELLDIADRIIGNQKIPGLSQSQLKRVNIGVELVGNPSILFLDEPTTGLNASAAMSVVRICKKIAQSGRAVVCTIHQPSSSLFYQFDSLVLLGQGGNQLFFGDLGHRCVKFIHYLQQCPFITPIKPQTNPAAWFLNETSAFNSMIGVDVKYNEFNGYFPHNVDECQQILDQSVKNNNTMNQDQIITQKQHEEQKQNSMINLSTFLLTQTLKEYYLQSMFYTRLQHRLNLLSSIVVDITIDDGTPGSPGVLAQQSMGLEDRNSMMFDAGINGISNNNNNTNMNNNSSTNNTSSGELLITTNSSHNLAHAPSSTSIYSNSGSATGVAPTVAMTGINNNDNNPQSDNQKRQQQRQRLQESRMKRMSITTTIQPRQSVISHSSSLNHSRNSHSRGSATSNYNPNNTNNDIEHRRHHHHHQPRHSVVMRFDNFKDDGHRKSVFLSTHTNTHNHNNISQYDNINNDGNPQDHELNLRALSIENIVDNDNDNNNITDTNIDKDVNKNDDNNNNNNKRATIWTQFTTLFARQHQSYWRNPSFLFIRLLTCCILSILFGLIYLNPDETTQSGMLSRLASICVIIYFAATVHASSVPVFESRIVFYRERNSGYYRPILWAFVSFLNEILWVIPGAFITVIIFYFLIQLPLNITNWILYYVCAYMMILSYSSTSLMIAAISPTQAFCNILNGSFLGLSFLFSGLTVTMPQAKTGWIWLFNMLPLSHGIELAIQIFKDNTTLVNILDNTTNQIEQVPVNEFVSTYLGMPYDRYAIQIGWLSLYIFVTQLIAVLATIFLVFQKR